MTLLGRIRRAWRLRFAEWLHCFLCQRTVHRDSRKFHARLHAEQDAQQGLGQVPAQHYEQFIG